jgi:hypothetical protein
MRPGVVAVTVHVKVWFDDSDPSEAVAVTLNVPADDGVPEITPVVLLIASPVGRPDAAYVRGVPFGSVADSGSDTGAPTALVWLPGLVSTGGEFVEVTVNIAPLLAMPPTVTTTVPVDAPDGAGTERLVEDQVVGDAATPLKVTVLVPFVDPKFDPAIDTIVPATPLVGVTLAIVGGDVVPPLVIVASAEYALTRPTVLYACTAT